MVLAGRNSLNVGSTTRGVRWQSMDSPTRWVGGFPFWLAASHSGRRQNQMERITPSRLPDNFYPYRRFPKLALRSCWNSFPSPSLLQSFAEEDPDPTPCLEYGCITYFARYKEWEGRNSRLCETAKDLYPLHPEQILSTPPTGHHLLRPPILERICPHPQCVLLSSRPISLSSRYVSVVAGECDSSIVLERMIVRMTTTAEEQYGTTVSSQSDRASQSLKLNGFQIDCSEFFRIRTRRQDD